jgi:hypothetical protein
MSDAAVIWEDLRINLKNAAELGLMARLWTLKNHEDEPFNQFSLDTAAAEVLHIDMDKDFQKINWKGELNDAHKLCKRTSFYRLPSTDPN